MNLTYRGNAYEVPASVKSNSVTSIADSLNQSPLKLIYRGMTYDYRPRPVASPSAGIVGESTEVTLIYRGITYQRKLQSPKPCQSIPSINWRWRSA